MNDTMYDDMIYLPHHVSKNHPRMSAQDRAAQFSPFAALTGYGDAIKETARITEKKRVLDDEQKLIINEKLMHIKSSIASLPETVFTYFAPDKKKDGGSYLTVNGKVKKIDEYQRTVVLEDGTSIPIDDIISIEYK